MTRSTLSMINSAFRDEVLVRQPGAHHQDSSARRTLTTLQDPKAPWRSADDIDTVRCMSVAGIGISWRVLLSTSAARAGYPNVNTYASAADSRKVI